MPEPDVRFLLVHHTVHRNDYASEHVPQLLRQIFDFHTGPDKGWPDIAYNFVVDRFGRIWEARAGSSGGAVAGDATGGNQGFDQKCAFLGDHRTHPPSPEARSAMVELLAQLADRHGIDTASGATATFISRGSNRWPAGEQVTTRTISGHRAMSRTTCPGDAASALVEGAFPDAVTARRSSGAPPEPAMTGRSATTTTTTTGTVPAATTPASEAADPPTTAATTSTTSTTSPTAERPVPAPGTSLAAPSPTPASPTDGARDAAPVTWPAVGAAGGVAATALGVVVALRNRRPPHP